MQPGCAVPIEIARKIDWGEGKKADKINGNMNILNRTRKIEN